MTVLNKLASALRRRDEVPNQELAVGIVRTRNKTGVTELVDNLSNKSKGIQGDCIKVLYEIGRTRAESDCWISQGVWETTGKLEQSPGVGSDDGAGHDSARNTQSSVQSIK